VGPFSRTRSFGRSSAQPQGLTRAKHLGQAPTLALLIRQPLNSPMSSTDPRGGIGATIPYARNRGCLGIGFGRRHIGLGSTGVLATIPDTTDANDAKWTCKKMTVPTLLGQYSQTPYFCNPLFMQIATKRKPLRSLS